MTTRILNIIKPINSNEYKELNNIYMFSTSRDMNKF